MSEPLAGKLAQALVRVAELEAALERLIDEMKAAGFPHEDCDECAKLRAATAAAHAALTPPEDKP